MQEQSRQPKFPYALDDEDFYAFQRLIERVVTLLNLPPTSNGNLHLAVCHEVRAVKGPDQ